MSTSPRLPQPLTPESLQGLMRQRAYSNPSDPRFPTYQRLVKRGFEILYPGPVRRSDTGNMIDTPPLPPHIVANQVDAVNWEMAAMDEGPNPGTGPDKTHDGMVHVESHVRDGGKTEVSNYWRKPPGHGVGVDKGAAENQNESGQDTLPGQSGKDDLRSVSPVPNPEMRNDGSGAGHFEAPREGGRSHRGIDILARAGDEVVSPIDGEVTKINRAYKDDRFDNEFIAVEIKGQDGNYYILRYVKPTDASGNPLIKEGDMVKAGDPIGLVQNRAARDRSGRMKNHIHLEMKDKDRNFIDPTPHFKRWRKER